MPSPVLACVPAEGAASCAGLPEEDGARTTHGPRPDAETRRRARDPVSVGAIEFGLVAGAIAIAIIAVLLVLGNDIAALFAAAPESG